MLLLYERRCRLRIKFIFSQVLQEVTPIAKITLNQLAALHYKLSVCLINFMERLQYVLI